MILGEKLDLIQYYYLIDLNTTLITLSRFLYNPQ